MKNVNTKKLSVFPSFGDLGVGIHMRSLNPFFLLLMKFILYSRVKAKTELGRSITSEMV